VSQCTLSDAASPFLPKLRKVACDASSERLERSVLTCGADGEEYCFGVNSPGTHRRARALVVNSFGFPYQRNSRPPARSHPSCALRAASESRCEKGRKQTLNPCRHPDRFSTFGHSLVRECATRREVLLNFSQATALQRCPRALAVANGRSEGIKGETAAFRCSNCTEQSIVCAPIERQGKQPTLHSRQRYGQLPNQLRVRSKILLRRDRRIRAPSQ
jgi:hypothetical protein